MKQGTSIARGPQHFFPPSPYLGILHGSPPPLTSHLGSELGVKRDQGRRRFHDQQLALPTRERTPPSAGASLAPSGPRRPDRG